MELYYIIHTNNIIELTINKHIRNKHYIALLEDILKTNNILDPASTLSFHSDSNFTTELSTFIHINYMYFNRKLIPILERNCFIVIPHPNNKIFIYYMQHDETTIQIFFDNNGQGLNEFVILKTFLNSTLETIKNNTSSETSDIDNQIFTVQASLSKYNITIQSKYLFEGLPQNILTGLPHAKNADSIITFLQLNGFTFIERHQCELNSQQYFHNRLIPR